MVVLKAGKLVGIHLRPHDLRWHSATFASRSAMETMMNQTSLVPEEGRQAIKTWVNAYQKERNRFKSYIGDSFSGFEKHLVGKSKSEPAESKGTSAKPKN
jgi:hypothetical protein